MVLRESNALHLEILETEPSVGVPMELDVFDGANPGTLLEHLEGAYGIQFTVTLNEPGAGSFRINRHDPKATAAIIDREHLAKVKIGGVYRFAFWMHERALETLDADGEEGGEEWIIGGPEAMEYLDRAVWAPVVYGAGGESFLDPTTGAWKFVNEQAGDIMARALVESDGRSPDPLEFLTHDFTSSIDTQGASWPASATLEIQAGTGYLATLKMLAALGLCDFRMRHDLRLSMYVELGRHFEIDGGDGTIVWRAGQNITTKLRKRVQGGGVKSRTWVQGTGESFFEVLRPDLEADPYVRRRESFLSFGNSSDPTTIQRAGEADLLTRAAQKEAISFGVEHRRTAGGYEPFVDFDLGDWMTLHEPGIYERETIRLVGMTITQEEDDFAVSLEANAIEYEALLKIQRALQGGASGSPGSGEAALVPGGTSVAPGGSSRVAVEPGDSPGFLLDKIEEGDGIAATLVGTSGARRIRIQADVTQAELDAIMDALEAHEALPHGGGGGQPGTGTYDATVLVHPDLIGYWPLDEIAGVSYNDPIGGFDGTGTVNHVLPGIGEFDRRPCALLTGEANARISMGSGRTIPAQYTLEAWMKPATGVDKFGLIGRWATQGVMLFFTVQGIQVHQTAQGSVRWRPGWAYWLDGLWHHVVGTYDGVTARLYIDGILRSSAAYAAHAPPAGGTVFEMGAYSNGSSLEYSGFLAAGALYDAALPLADIEDHYERGTGVSL